MDNIFIETHFCDVNISKQLDDLGFNESCFGYYKNGIFHYDRMLGKFTGLIKAPLLQQAILWINSKGDKLPKQVYVSADFMDLQLLKAHINNAIESIINQSK